MRFSNYDKKKKNVPKVPSKVLSRVLSKVDYFRNMQRTDGRGEPARTRRQSLEGRGGRKRGEDAERRGGQARSSEAIRGDLRTRSHDEREATRLGGARGWVKESRRELAS